MKWGRIIALPLAVVATFAVADAPTQSLRPQARATESTTGSAEAMVLSTAQALRDNQEEIASSAQAVLTSERPQARSGETVRRARAAQEALARGSVCSNPQIQGERIADINGAGRCGVDNPVRITSVSGLRLSTPATIDCTTAQALNTWVQRGVLPSVGNEGGGATSLRVLSHYACRTRNSQAGAKLSEHALGHAIDIGAIGLRDGGEISVLNGWGTGRDGGQLRDMHSTACGIFGTVLGPNANAFHRDHFHFDTARYRSGSYCR